MRHTQGPWYYNGDEGNDTLRHGHNVNTANGVICEVMESDTQDVVAANARLIAAAPELLEALEIALQQLGGELPKVDTIMQAAIKKAKGEA